MLIMRIVVKIDKSVEMSLNVCKTSKKWSKMELGAKMKKEKIARLNTPRAPTHESCSSARSVCRTRACPRWP